MNTLVQKKLKWEKERKNICKSCANTEEQPHFLAGIGDICEECKIYNAWGEFEKIKGQWKPFATFRGID